MKKDIKNKLFCGLLILTAVPILPLILLLPKYGLDVFAIKISHLGLELVVLDLLSGWCIFMVIAWTWVQFPIREDGYPFLDAFFVGFVFLVVGMVANKIGTALLNFGLLYILGNFIYLIIQKKNHR